MRSGHHGRRHDSWALAALALAGLCLAATPAPAAGPAGRLPSSRPVVLEDATGQAVGRVVEGTDADAVVVWRRADGRDLALVASRERLATVSVAGLLFEASDCSGPGFMLTVPPEVAFLFGLFTQAAVGPGNVVFVPEGPSQSRSIAAIWDQTATPPCQFLTGGPLAASVQPAVGILDLDDFVPPFRLR